MLGFKIFLVTAYLLSLILPFSIKPANGLYDLSELESLRAYCFLHADTAAKGENVVNDLVNSGLADSTYYNWSCTKIIETIKTESEAKAAKERAFADNCKYGNLTPTQYWGCNHAGYSPSGTICIFDSTDELSLSERLECEYAGYGPEQTKDKDTKD